MAFNLKEGYDLVEIGNKLANNYLYQALDGAFFHADPHPDNIFIKEGKQFIKIKNKFEESIIYLYIFIFYSESLLYIALFFEIRLKINTTTEYS